MQVKILDERLDEYKFRYQSEMAAGIDLYACLNETTTIFPNQTVLVPTGVAVHIGHRYKCGLVLPRSSTGCKGLVLGNTAGVIDSDYQGEIVLSLWNRTNSLFTLDPMVRVAQLIIVDIDQVIPEFVDEFDSETERGTGGLGSTGAS